MFCPVKHYSLHAKYGCFPNFVQLLKMTKNQLEVCKQKQRIWNKYYMTFTGKGMPIFILKHCRQLNDE